MGPEGDSIIRIWNIHKYLRDNQTWTDVQKESTELVADDFELIKNPDFLNFHLLILFPRGQSTANYDHQKWKLVQLLERISCIALW